jgi:hypothetical protein
MCEGSENEYYLFKVFPACPFYPSDKIGIKVKTLKLCIVWKNNIKAMGLILMNLNQVVRM